MKDGQGDSTTICDMNRDWLPVQLQRNQTRIKTFTKWMPNVLWIFHEMGTNSTYFSTGEPNTNPLTLN
jgi:hypothetical protein